MFNNFSLERNKTFILKLSQLSSERSESDDQKPRHLLKRKIYTSMKSVIRSVQKLTYLLPPDKLCIHVSHRTQQMTQRELAKMHGPRKHLFERAFKFPFCFVHAFEMKKSNYLRSPSWQLACRRPSNLMTRPHPSIQIYISTTTKRTVEELKNLVRLRTCTEYSGFHLFLVFISC